MFGLSLSEKFGLLVTNIFLTNYQQLGDDGMDDWGNKWQEKSLNETVTALQELAMNAGIQRLFILTSLAPTIFNAIDMDLDNITAYDANKFAYYCFYNRLPSSREQDKFSKIYYKEKIKRGIRTI